MKKNKIKIENTVEQRVCKKCGEPLVSKSKFKLCENCRRERAKTRKEIGGTVLALGVAVLSIVPGVKHFTKK